MRSTINPERIHVKMRKCETGKWFLTDVSPQLEQNLERCLPLIRYKLRSVCKDTQEFYFDIELEEQGMYKRVYELDDLPTQDECEFLVEAGEADALVKFILAFEPEAAFQATIFRLNLIELLNEVIEITTDNNG